LRDALLKDDTLYQIAQTPLMLSMLTLSYAGVESDQVPLPVRRSIAVIN